MKIEEFNIGKLRLLCAVDPQAKDIAYILYPMAVLHDWAEAAAKKYGVSVVVITGYDWDNDLTPWPAPGEPKGSPAFKGYGPETLATLTGKVIPGIDRRYNLPADMVRTLVGVSLSGLFTLWQWPQCDMFTNIATLSGSYWYEGFEPWVFEQSFTGKKGYCYMLLGVDEPHSNVPAFRKVGACTENIVGYLRRQGDEVTYNMVPGNHFQFGLERLDKAFVHLYKHKI